MTDRTALRLLLVDDSPEDREFYRRLLRADTVHEYSFVEADTGEEGLARFADEAPDCVLLDYRLPDLDGLEFLERLGVANPPVIVLTAQGSERIAVEAMKRGAQDYLPKDDLRAEPLIRAIALTVERGQLREALERRTADLERVNEELTRQIAQREAAEAAVQQINRSLERLVAERTEELSRANQDLRHEIAERRRMEAERLELLARERESNRLKDEFLATISHELRTPLNAVVGWAEVARVRHGDPAVLENALDRIERNARLQARLINDLLDMSRIVAGKLSLDREPVDPVGVVRSAVDNMRAEAAGKSIAIETELQNHERPLSADPTRLQQVVWNLLNNAVKFTPEGGRIDVRLTQDAASAELTVTDTGEGIEPSFLPHVFELFRQADGSTTRRHGGLGLGLGIVRRIVTLHGGSVEVQSQGRGKGTSFRVVLPREG